MTAANVTESHSDHEKKDRKKRELPPLPENPLSFSIEEAAAHLRVSRSAIYALLAEGKLPRRKVGRRTIILKVDLDAYFAAQVGVL